MKQNTATNRVYSCNTLRRWVENDPDEVCKVSLFQVGIIYGVEVIPPESKQRYVFTSKSQERAFEIYRQMEIVSLKILDAYGFGLVRS